MNIYINSYRELVVRYGNTHFECDRAAHVRITPTPPHEDFKTFFRLHLKLKPFAIFCEMCTTTVSSQIIAFARFSSTVVQIINYIFKLMKRNVKVDRENECLLVNFV